MKSMILHQGLIWATLLLSLCPTLPAASILDFSSTTYTVIEGNRAVEIAVQRTNDLSSAVAVQVATTNLTAKAGLDYVETFAQVTFLPNETRKSVIVPILNDGLVESVETFRVTLNNPEGGASLGSRAAATVRITDNDLGLQVELASYSVKEDAGSALLRVARRDDGNYPVSVDYTTADGTALAGKDYVGASGRLTFAPGETLKQVSVDLVNDTVPGPSKTFRFNLQSPSGGGVLGVASSAVVTIVDTDGAVGFEAASYLVREDSGRASIRVLRGENDSDATVVLATKDISAVAGQDYLGVTNTLRFATGERVKRVDIPILDDGASELQEKFLLTLSDPTGGAALGALRTTTVLLVDNDPGIGFERGKYSVRGNLGQMEVHVLRGGDGLRQAFTVDYGTDDVTAMAGVDYVGVAGTPSFGADEVVRSLAIPILAQQVAGSSKSFRLTLRNPSAGYLSETKATTIEITDPGSGFYIPIIPLAKSEARIRREEGAGLLDWEGRSSLWRADRVLGPWEVLGEVRAPHLLPIGSRTSFFQVRSRRPTQAYVPAGYDGQTPMALMVVLHGYSHSGAIMENYFRFKALAESRGLILCHPDGTVDSSGRAFWNATDACCNFYGAEEDDSGYLRSVIEEISRSLAVDPKRIYVTGFSNGGFMSHRMALDHADLIAGIASVSGATFLDPAGRRPSQPVNILQIHGTSDATVSYLGGALTSAVLPAVALLPGAVQTARIWAGLNGCSGLEEDVARTLDLDLAVDGPDTLVTRFTNSPAGGAVELWSIQGGAHDPTVWTGTPTSQLPGRIVDWLLSHPKP